MRLLTVKNLRKTFAQEKEAIHAVNGVSFHVDKGEIYGLIGLSGAGKSTLIRCLNLLERPDSGEIWFDGIDLAKQSEAVVREKRREMGMIFQHFNLFMRKTVEDNVAYPLRIAGRERHEIKKRAHELIDYIGLSKYTRAYPAELSGGQKQRVAIARALALNPKLLLSDEATSALDPVNTELVLSMLRQVVQDFGIGIVLITHQMEVAKALCGRVAVMENGLIIEENDVETLFLSPKHQATRRLIRGVEDTFAVKHSGAITAGNIYRLGFRRESVRRPLISHISRKYNVDINILAGDINVLQTGDVGYLVVSFEDAGDEEGALKALRENGVELVPLTAEDAVNHL